MEDKQRQDTHDSNAKEQENAYPDIDSESDHEHETETESEDEIEYADTAVLDNSIPPRRTSALAQTRSGVVVKFIDNLVRMIERKSMSLSSNFVYRKFVATVSTLLMLLISVLSGETRSWSAIMSVPFLLFALLYFLSPFDLIPDFIPIIGYLDDIIVVLLIALMFEHTLGSFRKLQRMKKIMDSLEDSYNEDRDNLEFEIGKLRSCLGKLKTNQDKLKRVMRRKAKGKRILGPQDSVDDLMLKAGEPSGMSDISEMSEEESQFICFFCMERRINRVFLPCGHLCCCGECGELFQGQKCPICRETVKFVERVFL